MTLGILKQDKWNNTSGFFVCLKFCFNSLISLIKAFLYSNNQLCAKYNEFYLKSWISWKIREVITDSVFTLKNNLFTNTHTALDSGGYGMSSKIKSFRHKSNAVKKFFVLIFVLWITTKKLSILRLERPCPITYGCHLIPFSSQTVFLFNISVSTHSFFIYFRNVFCESP